MTGMLCFPEMFRPHIEKSNLKVPVNFDHYDPKEYPHFHVFMIMHLAKTVEIEALEKNANLIAALSEEDIERVMPRDLIAMGLELGHANFV